MLMLNQCINDVAVADNLVLIRTGNIISSSLLLAQMEGAKKFGMIWGK